MILNLTDKPVTIFMSPLRGPSGVESDSRRTFLREPDPAWVTPFWAAAGHFERIPLYAGAAVKVYGLPASREGVLLIVDEAVRLACPTRTDLATPMGEVRRPARAEILGYRLFAVNGGAK